MKVSPVVPEDEAKESASDVNHNFTTNGSTECGDLSEEILKRNLENLRNKKNKLNSPTAKGKDSGYEFN